MKKIINIIIVFLILFNCVSFGNILDINNHWAYDNIVRNINNEYISGYPDNTFKPDNYIKVNEFLKIVCKVLDSNILQGTNKWDIPFIEYAKENSLISSIEQDYNELITRKQAFEIIYNFIAIKLSNINDEFYIPKDDTDKKIESLLKCGIVNGYPDKSLRLDRNITRAEIAKLVNKTVDYIDMSIYKKVNDLSILKKEDIYKYTNYENTKDNAQLNILLNTFRVDNSKVIYTDLGRYDNYLNVELKKYNNEVIDVLLALINNNNYVSNTYFRDRNCIIIQFGEKKEYVYNNISLFETVIYSEDQIYENNFKYNIQVNVYQLWKEINEIKNNQYINKYYLEKLMNVLKVFLNNEDVHNINQFIIKNEQNEITTDKYIVNRNNNCIYMYIKYN